MICEWARRALNQPMPAPAKFGASYSPPVAPPVPPLLQQHSTMAGIGGGQGPMLSSMPPPPPQWQQDPQRSVSFGGVEGSMGSRRRDTEPDGNTGAPHSHPQNPKP
jgi:hypothetical protein